MDNTKNLLDLKNYKLINKFCNNQLNTSKNLKKKKNKIMYNTKIKKI